MRWRKFQEIERTKLIELKQDDYKPKIMNDVSFLSSFASERNDKEKEGPTGSSFIHEGSVRTPLGWISRWPLPTSFLWLRFAPSCQSRTAANIGPTVALVTRPKRPLARRWSRFHWIVWIGISEEIVGVEEDLRIGIRWHVKPFEMAPVPLCSTNKPWSF